MTISEKIQKDQQRWDALMSEFREIMDRNMDFYQKVDSILEQHRVSSDEIYND